MSDSAQGQGHDSQQRRRWPHVILPVVLGLALIALLYWVIYRMPEPRVTLDYLGALVWPAVVVLAAYWLREPLRAKLAQLFQVEALGIGLKFAQVLSPGPSGLGTDTEIVPKELEEDEQQTVEKFASDTGEISASDTSGLSASGTSELNAKQAS